MANKKTKDTIVLRNTLCAFTCPYASKLDGGESHHFEKGECFEVPLTLVRKDEFGHETEVSTVEVLKSMFKNGIEEAGQVVSLKKIKEKDARIAELEAMLAKQNNVNKDEDNK